MLERILNFMKSPYNDVNEIMKLYGHGNVCLFIAYVSIVCEYLLLC